MGLFERFPYTNFHELNAAWLVKKMNELIAAMETFKATESLKFADPIIWNITTQYQKSTIVLDPTGNAYLSVQPVPAGVQLNNDEYWLEIFNFTDYTRTANKNLTVHVETNTTRATAAYNVDDWLIWEDVLYKVTAAIAIDDALVVGTNLVHFTVEDFIKTFINYATGLINQYKHDIDTSELAYRQQLSQDIANTTASLQSQLNLAISGTTVDSEVINARLGADGITYSTLGDAIRSQVKNLINPAAESGFYIYPRNAGYINQADNVVVYGTFAHTDPISVKTGDRIKLVCTATTSVSVISSYSSGAYTHLQMGLSANEEVYEYIVTADMNVVFSFDSAQSFIVLINGIEKFNYYVDKFIHDLNKVLEYSINMFNKADVTMGQIITYNAQGVQTVTPNSNWATIIIDGIEGWQYYTYSRRDYLDYWLDGNGNYIKGIGSGQTVMAPTEKAPINARKFLMNVNKNQIANMMLVVGSTLPNEYIPYFDGPRVKNANEMNVYHVGTGYDYPDPISCFNAIKNITGHKTVYIHEGTYDIYQLMGGDAYFSTIDPNNDSIYDVQPWLDNIDIIGIGEVIFNFSMNPSLSADIRWLFSPLNVRGDFRIKNLQINGAYDRYAIHDESGSSYPNTTHIYEDVIATNNAGGQAVGCGYSNNTKVIIKNCNFTTGSSASYSCHLAGTAEIEAENSVFNSSSVPTVRISQVSNNFCNAKFTNCLFNDTAPEQLELRPESEYASSRIDRTKVDLINCNVTAVKEATSIPAYTSIDESVTAYNTIAGTSTTLLS